MGALIFLYLIFAATVVYILMTSPDRMADRVNYKASVKDIWGLVKLCQTASFGEPRLELRPAKRSVLMDLRFENAETVTMILPLLLKKQQKAVADYLKLFADHDLDVLQHENKLVVHFDREDKNLGELIAHLYKEIFDANDTHTVRLSILTLQSDMNTVHILAHKNYNFGDDYSFEASSYRLKGKSARRVQTDRILGAVYFLFYPLMIVLSYKYWGLMTMCWVALAFFTFFAIYNFFSKKLIVAESLGRGSLLYCILLSATLATRKIEFVQSIPSVIGVTTAIMSAALLLGISKPKSEKNIRQKKNKSAEFKFSQYFLVVGGIGLFFLSEWARRNLSLEDWVYFFGFVRIEFMLAMLVVFAPAFALFYTLNKKKSD